MMDDGMLLHRSAGGDGEAFAELYDRLAPMILLRLRRRCSDEGLVEDVLQETFTAAWRAANSWDGRGEVAAWVWTIAARRLVDAFRRRAVRASTLAWDVSDQVDSDLAGSMPSAEDQVVGELLPDHLATAVAELAPPLRAVLQATVLDGLNTREAAAFLGIAEGTVKTRAMRARNALRQGMTREARR